MTFRQALVLNAHIRKGEKGSLVVYANTFTHTEEDADGQEVENLSTHCGRGLAFPVRGVLPGRDVAGSQEAGVGEARLCRDAAAALRPRDRVTACKVHYKQ